MNWGHFLERAANVFYTNILAAIAALLVVVLYLSGRRRSKSALFLAIMSGSFFLQGILVECISSQNVKSALGSRIAHDSLYVYLGIELCCCLLYIRMHTRAAVAQKILLGGIVLFIPYMIYYWSRNPAATDFNSNIITVEGFMIILACVYFFVELLTGRPDQNLFTEPAFWSISGMLVLFTVITPVFLLVNYFIHNREVLFYRLYVANNLCYSLLFVTFGLGMGKGKR